MLRVAWMCVGLSVLTACNPAPSPVQPTAEPTAPEQPKPVVPEEVDAQLATPEVAEESFGNWIFRPWFGRRIFQGAYEAHRMLRGMNELGMPIGVLMLEEWMDAEHPGQFDANRYPYPLTWVNDLRHLGITVLGRTDDVDGAPRSRRSYQQWHGAESTTIEFVHIGELPSEWESLPRALRAGLNASYRGHTLWHHDIGGTFGIPTKALYIRWLQFGVFSPIMLLHGDHPREPWRYDEETMDIARFYFAVRERLEPFLQEWLADEENNGLPIVRPMALVYEDDPDTLPIDTQYLFGPDLLVAPIVTPSNQRSIYLPEGKWVDAWTGETAEGPARFTYEAALYQVPLFLRAEQADTYSALLDNPPTDQTPPIDVELIGTSDARGIVPRIRYADTLGTAEAFIYRITNFMEESTRIGIRSVPVPGLRIDPDEMVRFHLAPGESREVQFHVWALPMTPPATYPITVEVRADDEDHPAPHARLVVSPHWRILGPFDGGVGSPTPIDGMLPSLHAVYTGHNNLPVRWLDLPTQIQDSDGHIDIGALIGDAPFSTTYLHTTIESRWARRIRLWTGSGDALTIWVNEQLVLDQPVHRNPERDEDRTEAVLIAGRNEIILRIQRDRAPHHLYFRIE